MLRRGEIFREKVSLCASHVSKKIQSLRLVIKVPRLLSYFNKREYNNLPYLCVEDSRFKYITKLQEGVLKGRKSSIQT